MTDFDPFAEPVEDMKVDAKGSSDDSSIDMSQFADTPSSGEESDSASSASSSGPDFNPDKSTSEAEEDIDLDEFMRGPASDSESAPQPEKKPAPAKKKSKSVKLDPGSPSDEDGNPRWEYLHAHAANTPKTALSEETLAEFAKDPESRALLIEAVRVRYMLLKQRTTVSSIAEHNIRHYDEVFEKERRNTHKENLSVTADRKLKVESCLEVAKEEFPYDPKDAPALRAGEDIRRLWSAQRSLLSPIKLKHLLPTLTKPGEKFANAEVCVLVYDKNGSNPDAKGPRITYDAIPVSMLFKLSSKRIAAALFNHKGRYSVTDEFGLPAVDMYAIGEYVATQINKFKAPVRDEMFRHFYECKEPKACAEMFEQMFGVKPDEDEFRTVPCEHVQAHLAVLADKKKQRDERKRREETMLKPKSRREPKSKSPRKPAASKKKTTKRKRPADESDEVVVMHDAKEDLPLSKEFVPRRYPSLFFSRGPDDSGDDAEAAKAYSELVKQFESQIRFRSLDDMVKGLANGTIESGTTSAQKRPIMGEDGLPVTNEDGNVVLATTPKGALNRQSGRKDGKLRNTLTLAPADSKMSSDLASEVGNPRNVLGASLALERDQRIQNIRSAAIAKIMALSLDEKEDSLTSAELHQFVSDQLLKPDEPLAMADVVRVFRAYSSVPKVITRVVYAKNEIGTLFGVESSNEINVEKLMAKAGANKGFAEYVAHMMLHYKNLLLVVRALIACEDSESLQEELRNDLLKVPDLEMKKENGFDPLLMWSEQ